MDYHEQQIEHLTTHEDLRNLVSDTFSYNMEHWAGEGGFSTRLR